MKQPSRYMRKYVREKPKSIYIFSLLLLFFSVIIFYPKSLLILLSVTILGLLSAFIQRPKIQKHYENLLSSRSSLSICEFSCEFNCHEIDTWVIRATYEQVQGALWFKEKIPIKVSDRLKEDLLLDDDVLDLDLAEQISQRTGRTLKNCESNPYFGKVKTVKDLVLFFNYQEKLT